jgi:signal transduction histidine kinase/DNA-binding response OmpR family regulator
MTRHSSRHTYLLALCALIISVIFSLMEIASFGSVNLLGPLVILVIASALIIVLHRIDRYLPEAFSIPLTLYLTLIGMPYVTGYYSNYFFLLCLGISCLGALFFNSHELLKFILVSNLLNVVQVALSLPVRATGLSGHTLMPMPNMLFNWFSMLIGSLFIYKVITFAEDKSNVAKSAHDSFVGLLNSTPDPIVLLDTINRVTYISDSFMKMVHTEQSMYAKGRSIFDLIKDQKLKELFYQILSEGGAYQSIHEIALDGTLHFFDIVVFVITGETKGRLVNIIDVTPVMKAKFEAEAASRSKTAFLATMSHEIRTPLNAIIGLSEIELQKRLPSDTLMDLGKIHNSGSNLLAIVNDILDISKIEAGNLELIPVDYDMPSIINDTVQLNVMRIGSKRLRLKLKIDASIPVMLFGDELRIKQLLNNLLSNAIKYTNEGSVLLTINWEKKDNTAWITYIVKDTGRGIKPEDISKLFSEYQQFDTKANRHIEGTGLGLSITKKLLMLMNGSISVESEYGTGSTFTMKIPQRIVDETPIGESIVRELENFHYKDIHNIDGLQLVRNHMPYGKVLVVDDVETNLDVAKGLLLPYGLSIDTASSGKEAIAKIKAISEGDPSSGYDLVLMDHMMPGMDGIEAVRIIRNEISGEYGRAVPIVALTANALTGNEEMFLTNGFNAFIAKPIDVMQLDAVLNTWVRDRKSVEVLKQAEMVMSVNENTNLNIFDNLRIEGLDLIRGKKKYNNDAAYLDILRSWHKHTPALLEKMRNPFFENLPEYAITVHGIKGASLGICADELSEKAEELEQYAKSGNIGKVQADNSMFIGMAEALLANIGELLEKVDVGKDKKPKQKRHSPDASLLAKLLDAVKSYKSTLMEETMCSIEEYDYDSGVELVTWLRQQMDNLEYDAIRQKLESQIPKNIET